VGLNIQPMQLKRHARGAHHRLIARISVSRPSTAATLMWLNSIFRRRSLPQLPFDPRAHVQHGHLCIRVVKKNIAKNNQLSVPIRAVREV
jgi:hypothetical protein